MEKESGKFSFLGNCFSSANFKEITPGPIPTSEPFSQMQNILKYHIDICELSEVGSRVLLQKVPMMTLKTILSDKMNT